MMTTTTMTTTRLVSWPFSDDNVMNMWIWVCRIDQQPLIDLFRTFRRLSRAESPKNSATLGRQGDEAAFTVPDLKDLCLASSTHTQRWPTAHAGRNVTNTNGRVHGTACSPTTNRSC
jgi:hypothetical protein